MGGLGLGLVAIRGIALVGGGIVWQLETTGMAWDQRSLYAFDDVDWRSWVGEG